MAPLEQYALIGGLQTAALVRLDGTVDWMCLPRFDSPAVFAGLLGTADNGFWRLGPTPDAGQAPPPATWRGYRGESLILDSWWETPHGLLRVTDFMPPKEGPPCLVRIAQAVTGRVSVTSTMNPRFHYGRTAPLVTTEDGRMRAVAGSDAVWLDTDAQAPTQHAQFSLTAGQRVTLTLSWGPSHAPPPRRLDLTAALEALEATEEFWAQWISACTHDGPYPAAVIRSLLTLKALTYAPTGGIVAAPTTSLPEDIGGCRNWDYRFTWLRDAAITLVSLLRCGYREEARAWREWLLRAVAGDPENLQIMYGVAGERELPERELPWLAGYEGSGPVRIGNAAATQWQLDVYGEVIEALYLSARRGLILDAPLRGLLVQLVQTVQERWQEPDEGIWEVRGPRRHFVHSKVMAWVAVDRTIKLIESGDADGPLDRWRDLRDDIHREICEKGYDKGRNTFTQSYGSKELDASLLLIPQVGFLPPDDKRVIGTIEAIQRELSTPDGFILRYPTSGDDAGVDGLQGDEGAFLACSFWLAQALTLIGRVDEARKLFEKLLTLRNDLGLLAEEWDPRLQRQVGNFPQAFSHGPLIEAALALNHADGYCEGGESR
ncbi:glycoside hydrolase family 15 protein [Streptomyces sp. NPDC053474]|uniref:glycoside hydrolase family 15 protein n=1 Tax=Streptomyces sp. NPDC053474 TaxID=3365704 RepID=UPI0037D9482B